MAEIDIERKQTTAWPWILLGLVVLALLAWWLLGIVALTHGRRP